VVTEAVVLAGGLGTRLRAVVSDLPKAMAPVAGQPFLAYLLQFLQMNGVRRVVLSVGYRKEAIHSFFGANYGGLKILYSVEEAPLGTGGGLQQSLAYVDGPFAFVLNGDTFLRLNYPAMAQTLDQAPETPLVVALRRVADAGRYGAALVTGGRIQGFSARGASGPGLINAGCYLTARDIFQRYPMPPKFSFEEDFLQARASEVRPAAFECDVPFLDIGIPEALAEAQFLIPEWMNASA
jgi:D-glycero-alpha-D-manno-heptose 1-phosphate guanylyltransferase